MSHSHDLKGAVSYKDHPYLYDNGCAICDSQAMLLALAHDDTKDAAPWINTPEDLEKAMVHHIHCLYRWHGIPTSSEMRAILAECY